ncbi:hypothetical protein IU469_30480 [Nocardia puris]|uniref:hypothetical protein n=1 Tax=Nocardia puris TaxID=208602 RepID=UPI00189544B3|nr:hypothetical protein [Nocardia puris]MBF6215377.1 hypothetical protein [Nocardia puris]MBF6370003.1 hypothetical protein [Nocardia puris]
MTDLRTRGQLRILAQTLDVAPEELASLERLGAQDLRELRERISDHLFDAHAATFARVSKLAPLVPNALAAKVALKAIPPEVGGRAGGAVGLDHPDRAAGLLAELTAEYMADAAPFLDPRAIPVLAPRLPAEVLVPGANELLRRKEYTTASRFVEYATDELIRGFERGITDDVGLLHTAALTPSTDRLNDIVRVLPEQRRLRIVRASLTGSDDTLVAGISVLSRLESPLAEEITRDFLSDLDEAAVDRVLAVAVREGAVEELLFALSAVDDALLQPLADGLSRGGGNLVGALLDGAESPAAQRVLRALGDRLDDPTRELVAERTGPAE